MSTRFDISSLNPVQVARVNAALDKVYNFDGRTCSLRAYIESLPTVDKRESDGTIDYNRNHFNRLDSQEQEEYMARLRAKRIYWVNDVSVPKIVYDVIVSSTAQNPAHRSVTEAARRIARGSL